MYRVSKTVIFLAVVCSALARVNAQTGYQTISVDNGGTITGTVKWSGPAARPTTLPITKDPNICDPDSQKKADLDRLLVGPGGGVANTVVFLRNIARGKAMDLPEPRRFLDQKHCRYEPHILLVPKDEILKMKSSDATLHTIHMDGAATFNLPFPFPNQVISRNMKTTGVVNLKCNGGHTWMNAEMFVVPHPYYAVTDQTGKFELTDVPPGEYQLVAWHEGWTVVRNESSKDVLTERRVQRPIFSEPKTWQKTVTVKGGETSQASFVISDK